MIIISQNTPKKGTAVIIVLCCVLLAAMIAAGAWFYFTMLADDGLILSNVYVADVDLSGTTPEQAKVLIQRQTDLTYPYEDMVIRFPDQDLRLNPSSTGITLDIDRIVSDAYAYGRSGSWQEKRAAKEAAATTEYRLELGNYLTMDAAYIQAQLDAYEQAHSSDFTPSAVLVDGERPALDAANYNAENPCQVLMIYTGNPGRVMDMEGIFEQIVAAYAANEFLVIVDAVPTEELPEAIDLEALYAEHCTAAVDAAFSKDAAGNIIITDEVYGYDFDLEAAQAMLAEAEYDQTLEIPFRYMEPAVLAAQLNNQMDSGNSGSQSTGDSTYPHVLASYKTSHTSDANRNTNLKLACKAINGKVLMPGEKFDYNTTLGKRTTERGYKAAGAYSNGATVQEVGGGICQVSSTLYYCTLMADLKINARRAHSYISTYMPLGMDAAVSWGGPEFAFTNNTGYPLKIEAWVSGGYVNVKLLGTNTKTYKVKMEYEVLSTTEPTTEYKKMTAAEAKAAGYYDGQVLQTAYTGKQVKSYKCKYDLDTGKLISRAYEATSNYKVRNKIVVDIVESTTKPTEPTTKPTEAPTTKPTEAPTTKPTEAPTTKPTEAPTTKPTEAPTEAPTAKPTEPPTEAPTAKPTEPPTEAPTAKPTEPPTEAPTEAPDVHAETEAPTQAPTEAPTAAATEGTDDNTGWPGWGGNNP